jgi:hypothetical protein
MELTIDRATLEKLLRHATSAARIVGHSDALTAGPLVDHVDAIVHELSELLGNPHLIAAPVPSARPSYDDDEPTEVRPCPALRPRKQLAEGVQ